MEFSERIKKIIEHSKLSPAEFAEEIGVQRSSISHIISGRNKPSLDFITKIKTAFPQFQWDWLITGEGAMLNTDDPPEVNNDKTQISEKKKASLPSLFSLIDDENFGKEPDTSASARTDNPPESNNADTNRENKILSDYQPSENYADKSLSKVIKRIVFFYGDGTFETYEN